MWSSTGKRKNGQMETKVEEFLNVKRRDGWIPVIISKRKMRRR